MPPSPRIPWRGVLAAIALLVLVAPAARAQVTATVDWSLSKGRSIPGDAYGLNVWQGFDPAQAGTPGDAVYKERVALMKPGIIRYHSAEMIRDSSQLRGWATNLDTDAPGWDKNKINAALTGAYSFGPRVMMNIPDWPARWKNADGTLNEAYWDEFADWCALLVRYVNVDLGKNVRYWEILNEPDLKGYSGRTSWQKVGQLWALCAQKMKAVDSSIICGGPAFAQAWDGQRENMRGFLDTCGSNLAFISFHGYGTTSATTTTQNLYNAGANLWGPGYWITTVLNEYGKGSLPRYHDEVNVNASQTQNNLDSRTWNAKGMIFNALALMEMATRGYCQGAMIWNESDGWNGIMDGPAGYTRRPTSYLVEQLNRDGFGEVMTASTGDASKVKAYALKSGTYVKLILVNRAETTQTVQFTSLGGLQAGTPDSTTFTTKQVAGYNGGGIFYPASATVGQLKSGYSLAADTVTFLILNTSGIQTTQPTLNVSFSGTSPGTLNLTTEGTADWGHWGTTSSVTATSHSFDRKISGDSRISDFSLIGGANEAAQITNSPTSFSWSDGTPNASVTGALTGVRVRKQWATGHGWRITIPADTTQRTLKIYCGTFNAGGQLVAGLSSASGLQPVTVAHAGQGYANKDGVYTIVFRANSSGQTLTVDFTATTNLGSYSHAESRLFSATLQ